MTSCSRPLTINFTGVFPGPRHAAFLFPACFVLAISALLVILVGLFPFHLHRPMDAIHPLFPGARRRKEPVCPRNYPIETDPAEEWIETRI